MVHARSYVYSIASSAITLVLGLVTGVLVNRFLGPLDRGELASMTFSVTTTSGIVVALVSSQAIISYLNRAQASGVAAAIIVLLVQTLATVPIAFTMMTLFHKQAETSLTLAAALVIVLTIMQTMYAGLCAIQRAHSHFDRVALTVVLVPALYAVLLGVCIGFDVLNPAYAMAASIAPLVVCVFFLAMSLPVQRSFKKVARQDVMACIRQGFSFLPVMLIGLIVASADRAMLLKLSDLESLGLFVAAVGLTSPIAVLAEAILQISFVEVSRVANGEEARTLALARFRIGQLVLLLLSIFVTVVGPWFLVAASGAAFYAAVPALYWLVCAAFFRGLVGMLDTNLRALGLLFYSFWCGLAGAAILVFSGLMLISSSGAVGAAQAVLVANVFTLMVQVMVWRRKFGTAWCDFWGLKLDTLNSACRHLMQDGRARP